MITAIEALPEHVHEVMADLREHDRRELALMTRNPIGHSLAASIAAGNAFSAVYQGQIIGLYGAPKTGMSQGTPWMVATNQMFEIPHLVARYNRKIVSGWMKEFDYMFNYIDTNNEVTKNWIKWLGFRLWPARPYGPYGHPFHKFDWVKT